MRYVNDWQTMRLGADGTIRFNNVSTITIM